MWFLCIKGNIKKMRDQIIRLESEREIVKYTIFVIVLDYKQNRCIRKLKTWQIMLFYHNNISNKTVVEI